MPTYDYECRGCGHRLEAFQWYSEPPLTTCPSCAGESLGRMPGGGSCGIVYGNPTTVGQQAEINARRFGKEQMQRMQEQERARAAGWTGPLPDGAASIVGKARTPWFRDGSVPGVPALDKPLDLTKVPDVKKYVEGSA